VFQKDSSCLSVWGGGDGGFDLILEEVGFGANGFLLAKSASFCHLLTLNISDDEWYVAHLFTQFRHPCLQILNLLFLFLNTSLRRNSWGVCTYKFTLYLVGLITQTQVKVGHTHLLDFVIQFVNILPHSGELIQYILGLRTSARHGLDRLAIEEE
jgi:hypothetical protein